MDIVESEDSYRMSGDKIQLKVLSGGEKGVFAYSINHTRITWGLDVENIIRTHIGKILEKPTGFDKIVRRISGPLNLFTTVFVGLYITNLLIDLFFYFLLTSENPENGQTVAEIASAYLVNGHIAKYIVASLVVSVVVFVLFSALVSSAFQNFIKPKPSFIILSKFDEARKAKRLKKYNRRWAFIIAVLLTNIVVAIVIAALEERMSSFFSAVINYL